MFVLLSQLIEQVLTPIIIKIFVNITTKQTVDKDFVSKLLDASSEFEKAKTHEARREARRKLVSLTRDN